MLVAFWGAVDITPMAGIKRTGEQNKLLDYVVAVVVKILPRLNLFCMGCQRRVALPTQTKIILELSIIVALIVNNCL